MSLFSSISFLFFRIAGEVGRFDGAVERAHSIHEATGAPNEDYITVADPGVGGSGSHDPTLQSPGSLLAGTQNTRLGSRDLLFDVERARHGEL